MCASEHIGPKRRLSDANLLVIWALRLYLIDRAPKDLLRVGRPYAIGSLPLRRCCELAVSLRFERRPLDRPLFCH